ncbi:hypothetical protein LOTGIDRAFT_236146 [Lottia gigantea]|uniref:L-serine ammonia-lyase n=1 Tax=Lottia gigantea TaxID=225164 RepID=V3ZUL6_LOTGI|nr:hypothetical protein LOTGIDRAFT_236146 [Lottia gigantea]ESO84621.1 hypothetical protein LOTGIDRAFT_236146 [Lottia gigantea]
MNSSNNGALYLVTPTVESKPLTKHAGFKVHLKLENLQPPGSFKLRGISYLCQKAINERNCKKLVCASGGNAGLATAYSAQQLKTPCTIVLPKSTPDHIADKLRDYGAEVIVKGEVFDHANEYAESLALHPECQYVHPFNLPELWEGHTSLILEAADQLKMKPDVIITCVGGGGLLNGIVQGMRKVGWEDIPIVAMETIGADCFNKSVIADKIVTLPDITSVAKCLGSLTVSKQTFDYYKEAKPEIHSVIVDDREAVNACLKFADDHRFLVEPACGATLAAIYSNSIQRLQEEGRLGTIDNALVIVCGGSMVNLETLQDLKKQFNL